jgi:LysM repeat protein
MARRRRRSPGRWLAPLALVTCAVAVYAVVHNTLADSGSTSANGTEQRSGASSASGGKSKSSKKKRHRKVYRVKSGDTLTAISVRTGVSLETIQRLNPGLDAQSLHTGQKVKLAP